MRDVQIVQVGPRDGLQNEARALSVSDRFEFIKALGKTGLRRIEVGAFVSPKWVPQMQGSGELTQKLFAEKSWVKNLELSALVPNVHGMTEALKTPLKEVAVFGSCSETFSQKISIARLKKAFNVSPKF